LPSSPPPRPGTWRRGGRPRPRFVDDPAAAAENDRAAHAVVQANEQGLANTDDLRTAFPRYRWFFERLLAI
jgi:hypothetical protein